MPRVHQAYSDFRATISYNDEEIKVSNNLFFPLSMFPKRYDFSLRIERIDDIDAYRSGWDPVLRLSFFDKNGDRYVLTSRMKGWESLMPHLEKSFKGIRMDVIEELMEPDVVALCWHRQEPLDDGD